MPTTAAHFIVNPVSGGGRTRRRVAALENAIERLGMEATFSYTTYRGHGRDLARLAIEDGHTTLVACGGDGTFNEVVNGVFDAGATGSVRVGTVPLGTGKDIGRCLGMPTAMAGLRAVATGQERLIDVGLIEGRDEDGLPMSRYFVLEAAAGWVAEISASVPRWLKLLGDTAPYVVMTLVKALGPMNREFTLEIDGERFDGPHNTVSVHNMEYWGGDLLVAPGSAPDDGLFDLVRWGALSRRSIFGALNGQKNGGTHLQMDGIECRPARTVKLDASRRTSVDLDGEPGGYLPATITLVPSALRFVAPTKAGDASQ